MTGLNVTLLSGGYCSCPEHLALRGGGRSALRFPALFALLEHPLHGPMLYDTGYSHRFFEETRSFPQRLYRWATPVTLRPEETAVAQLEARGISPQDVSKVFVSHFHADHVSALGDFPRAQYVCLSEAWNAVRRFNGFAALRRAFLPGLIPADFEARTVPADRSPLRALPPGSAPWTEGFDVLGDGSLLAVPLPGHAAGQMGLVAHAAGNIWFFVADAAWLARGLEQNRPPNRLADLLFDDPSSYRTTFQGLRSFQEHRPDVLLVPSHCQQTYEKLGDFRA